ncbi:hypothetical protein [Neomegalonema sp.]|uniref:hypothetical protein n=1 Tax=Neomegalonema sp. TaxID=2039713 RepID=UPI002635F935|nr:hypothetical protein [Neomegalonema sp.]MDD2870108.1 hypothetical protein [Neomegalonema sp.]
MNSQNHIMPPAASVSLRSAEIVAPDWGADLRSRLLWWSFDAGLAPVHALDQAREMWDFVRGPEAGEAAPPFEAASVLDRLNEGVIGIALGEGGVWRRVDHDGATLHVDYASFQKHPIYGRIREVWSAEGVEMVEIPRFWLRGEHRSGERFWWISPLPCEGFRLHPAFRAPGGASRESIRISKHLASRKAGGEGIALTDGRQPWTNLKIEEARRCCRDLGEGWRLWSIYDLSAVQLLALIDKGAPVGGVIGIFEAEGVAPTGVLPAVWRGIRDLWGNAWQFADGLRINALGGIEIWGLPDPGAEVWIDTGVAYGPGVGDGFPVAFHEESGADFDLSTIFLPSRVVGGAERAATRDHVWGCGGDRGGVALSGGSWISRHDSGLFSLSLSCHAEQANPSIGFRPVFAP